MTKAANGDLAALTQPADLTRYEHLTRIADVAVVHAIENESQVAMPVARHAVKERDALTVAEAQMDLETYWQQEYARTTLQTA